MLYTLYLYIYIYSGVCVCVCVRAILYIQYYGDIHTYAERERERHIMIILQGVTGMCVC